MVVVIREMVAAGMFAMSSNGSGSKLTDSEMSIIKEKRSAAMGKDGLRFGGFNFEKESQKIIDGRKPKPKKRTAATNVVLDKANPDVSRTTTLLGN